MSLNATSISDLIGALAARTSTPGGGAAAAIAAALGCAAGAMATRYTAGAKYAAVETAAQQLGDLLLLAARDCIRLGDADAEAYAAVTSARKAKDSAATAVAEQRAGAVPADLLATCAQHATELARFMANCNPYLLSDVKVGIHLLAGAGRAAWQTLLVNHPSQQLRDTAATHLEHLLLADRQALTPTEHGS
jgi:formiminotetrahydrofolate cyclodeaminase